MEEQLVENVAAVQQQIAEAAKRSGRNASDVCLVGVTKYVDVATTRALVAAGCRTLGENRPQVLWEKSSEMQDLDVRWHMIGHLQRNKVKRTVESTALIHSCDSLRLLKSIQEAGLQSGKLVDVLLEVNVSGEVAKHGFSPDEMASVIEAIEPLNSLRVTGLMCMAGLGSGQQDVRREFDLLRELRESNREDAPPNVELRELSMGMSRDFEVAIEAGATLVRVGSSLFRGLR
ncbi:MAG: YggS family pyridoxal phosphate-dependent enzyme [Mariniblastus sp.]|nr:YggS family pyridoxal phosphate-dependent enzyme [Mariniblastus sp.]